MYQNFNLQFTSPLSSLASVLPLMLPLFGIHFLKTSVHHPLLPLLERSSKPISTQQHILLSSFSLMASPWCRPVFVHGILHIAIVLLRLRVHYPVEIKHYKIQIRVRMVRCFRFKIWPHQNSLVSNFVLGLHMILQ